MKPIKCYAPVNLTSGEVLANWANTNKGEVTRQLNESYAGWREDGFAVRQFEMTMIPSAADVRGILKTEDTE